ncbi:3-oxoacyl-ACP reductase [Actinocatenispora thailandica]|uniref:3-oxoacyl-ACP reductase n=1 Tax=Actinocatenispora thailandica TaxID=227318 RepID=A0A7R7DSE0_9ACTN|nr:SDR family oxidoreductase [Actinocatenispora thailandica]BCJ36785.1 3-oxoacyl-ACP reductase [Actinocatenispora thailandica]
MTRSIVVTGGGTGIGRATAARFAAAGESVTILGRRADVLARAAEQLGATAVVCDVSDPDALTAALGQLPAQVDVLVNNAGGNTDLRRPAATTLADVAAGWRANLDANLLSAVLTTTLLADRLQPGGTVVGIGSIAASRGSGGGSYGATKAALATWNIDLAGQLGPRDITANVVSCGYIAETEFFADQLTEQRRGTLIGQTSTGRAGTPDDVAALVEYLASPGARHITAQVININGGAFPTR